MAKNQSRTPGRDVRGGSGKRVGNGAKSSNKIVPRNLPSPGDRKSSGRPGDRGKVQRLPLGAAMNQPQFMRLANTFERLNGNRQELIDMQRAVRF